jgi:regulator of sigma E protease
VTTILAFLFVLGVLVFIHELGHFLMARWHGVRVITFSLGFGPKLLKWTRGATEYCISVIPLGGYVKLAGESAEEERSGASDEFMSKSKWVRFQVYLMGPVMNIALAFVLTTAVLYNGADVPLYPTSTPVIGSVTEGSPAEKSGLKVGDTIVNVAGKPVKTWEDVDSNVMPKVREQISITVDRGGSTYATTIVPASANKYEAKYDLGSIGVGPVFRPQVAVVTKDSPAEHAGLKFGDVIVGVDDQHGLIQPKLIEYIRAHPKTPVMFHLERAGQPVDLPITPNDKGPGGVGQIGAQIAGLETRKIDPTFPQAIKMGAQQTWDTSGQIVTTLKGLFTRDTPVKQLMGPVAIAQLSGDAASLGWVALVGFMSMISLNLGLMNLLPIPILDGGHIAILALEGASRRDFSIKVKERILFAGFALIMLLMVTVIYNDVARIFR